MVKTQRVVITPGEPAGIGPDLIVQLAQREWPVELVVCADATLLTDRAAMLGLPLTLRPYSPNSPAQPQTAGTLTLLPVALRESVTVGQLAVENGHYVVETLARACDGCLNDEFAALITGPVHKGVINDAGIPFTGHTEFFEERSQAKKVVMMLATEELRVALATTHLPLRDIADAITPALLHEVIAILHHDLRTKFGIAEPRILVCGLNLHVWRIILLILRCSSHKVYLRAMAGCLWGRGLLLRRVGWQGKSRTDKTCCIWTPLPDAA